MQDMNTHPTLESALNFRFRGHDSRDWAEWHERHAYNDAGSIPLDATKALIGRQKLNYRGISERPALRHLIAANVDQPFLEEISDLTDLERLELEWPMTAKDLSPLLRLEQLAFLSIDSPRNIADFRLVLDLPVLRTLIITNPTRMVNLEWLAEGHHLEVIGIEGGTWTPYTIQTLRPIAGLRSLRAFLGVSTKLSDKSLAPLADCPSLEYLGIACVAPQAEFNGLKAAKPDLICDWFRPEMWTALKSTRQHS